MKAYKSQSSDNKKWRGNVKLWLPKDDGSEKDDYTKRTFNNFMACVEESNPGYHWGWDENTLKDKKIGILAREFADRQRLKRLNALGCVVSKLSHLFLLLFLRGGQAPVFTDFGIDQFQVVVDLRRVEHAHGGLDAGHAV